MNPFIQSKIVLFLSLNWSEPVWAGLNWSKPFKTDKHDTHDKTIHVANMTHMKSATCVADSTHAPGDMTRSTETARVAKTTCVSGPSRVSNVASVMDTTRVSHSTGTLNVACVAEMTRVSESARCSIWNACVPQHACCMSYPPHVLHLAHVRGSATHVVLSMRVTFVTCVMCVARVMFIHLNLA